MTPFIFISFLISLVMVDYRYSVQRSRYHALNPSRLPTWLHRILYRYQPYEYVVVDEHGRPVGDGQRFLHSKQRKLMRMEVAEAFEVRRTVLVVLAVLGAMGVVAVWGLWRIVRWQGWVVGLGQMRMRGGA